MSRFVRPSKYRHVYGSRSKVNYENAKISGSAWDTDLVTASGKYIAVNWQVSGGGAFAILPSFSPNTPPAAPHFPTKLPDILPLARSHTGPVLDTAWSPFDDNLVVSGGEDGKIFLWRVEDNMFDGWGEDHWAPEDLAPSGKLNAGGRKVGQVVFHPAASNLLTSASGDHLVRVWDLEGNQDAPVLSLAGHKDSIQSIAWNSVGTTLATTCRDRKLRLFDPRAGADAVRVTDGHGGIKGSRVVWLGDRDRIATTGFSKMSDRQLSLWDTAGLTNLDTQSLDSSSGIIIPFFAEGNDVLFLSGKGDGNIRYYEFADDQFHFLNEYKTSDPQRGIGFIPRRALECNHNEIARGYKLAGSSIESLAFVVPRKAEGFQTDLYPAANSAEPALTAGDWFGGKNVRPNMVDLETNQPSANTAPIAATPVAKVAAAAASSAPASGAATPKESVPPTPKESAPKESTPPTPKESKPATPVAATPREPTPEPEPKEEAKSLEIEQPDESSDDEPEPASARGVAAASVAGAGAGLAAAVAGKTPDSSNGDVKPPTDTLLVKLLSSSAKLPTRGSPLSAGYDLYAAADTTIPKRGKALVETQISIAVPEGTYGRIAPRSGLASKHAIDVGAGVIDADYRGPVGVLLFNHADTDFDVAAGDRVAQLILEKCHLAPIQAVDDLDVTMRGAGGFGSTGGFRG